MRKLDSETIWRKKEIFSYLNIWWYSFHAVDYEPPVYGVSSISACQTWAKALEQFGANYFLFDGITEECKLYSALQVAQLIITNDANDFSFLYFLLLCFIQANCKVIGGPKTAPPLAECPSSSWTLALHFFGHTTVFKWWNKLYDLLSREAAYNTIFIYQSIWPNLIVNSFRLNCSTCNNFFL